MILHGPCGTGKTTLLYLMAGLYFPTDGNVLIDGDEVSNRNKETLSKFFIIPDEFDFPDTSLSTFLKLRTPYFKDFSFELFEENLRLFGMEGDCMLRNLSLGQKKKVMISFALATGVKALLMDEPTNGLDIPSKKIFRKVIARNMRDDQTIIMSTHLVHDVDSLLDRIVVVKQGGHIFESTINEIEQKYAFEYRTKDEMDDDVLYYEPSPQGNATLSLLKEGMEETPVNLELFFNAITSNKL